MVTDRQDGPGPFEQDSIYRNIGASLLNSAPQDWEKIEFTLDALAEIDTAECIAHRRDGSSVAIDPPDDAWELLSDLRESMYQPGKGTWYKAKFAITRPGNYDVDFDYDNEPEFDIPPAAQSYHFDLERFPRDDTNIPSWLRAKLTEARNTPPSN
jgi:hypothetical protein